MHGYDQESLGRRIRRVLNNAQVEPVLLGEAESFSDLIVDACVVDLDAQVVTPRASAGCLKSQERRCGVGFVLSSGSYLIDRCTRQIGGFLRRRGNITGRGLLWLVLVSISRVARVLSDVSRSLLLAWTALYCGRKGYR